jgi:hypothetical protein
MDTRPDAVYNLTRRVLLNDKLTVTDCASQPLRLLNLIVNGLGLDSESALWLNPLHAAPGLPRVFPFDVLYLDKDNRVVDTAEIIPGNEFPKYRPEVASALAVPESTLNKSGTKPGDLLMICPARELQSLLARAGIPFSAVHAANQTPGAIAANTPKTPAIVPPPGPVAPALTITETPGRPQPTVLPAAAKPSAESPEAEAVFSNWVDSSSDPTTRGAVPSALPLQTTSPAQPVRNSAKTTPANTDESPVNRKDIRRFLFERVNPADSERPLRTGASVSRPANPDQKAPVSPQQDSSATASREPRPSRSTRITRSTTSFATSSLPMWHVSQSTAIPPVSQTVQNPGSSASPIRAMRAPAPPTQSDQKQGPVRPAPSIAAPPVASSDSSSMAAGTPRPVQPTALPQNPPQPPNHLPPAEDPPVQDLRRKMWPKTPATVVPAPDVANTPSVQVARSSMQNGNLLPDAAIKSGSTPSRLPPQTRPAISSPQSKQQIPNSPQKSLNRWWTTRTEADSKNDNRNTLRSRLKHWLIPASEPSDRRRAERHYVPGMVAHYFTGGAPRPQTVADISMTGLYLLTEDRWMRGTMIQMTMQKPSRDGERRQSIAVLARIVRRGTDGVGVEFVMPEAIDSQAHDIQPSQATDRVALARFL